MLIIIFISLAIAYFFIRHFENRRMVRKEEEQERKREAFNNLLSLLKEKEDVSKKDLPPGAEPDGR